MLRTQEKERTSQQRGNMSAKADVPPLCRRPITQSLTATEANAARCHGSYSSSSSFCCVFWHLWQVSFSFFLGRKGFRARSGPFRFHGAIKGAAASTGQGGEGKRRRASTAASSIQKTGKVAPVTAARLSFTHSAGGGKNTGTKGQKT